MVVHVRILYYLMDHFRQQLDICLFILMYIIRSMIIIICGMVICFLWMDGINVNDAKKLKLNLMINLVELNHVLRRRNLHY